MRPIAIFYHCLFYLDRADNLLPNALAVVAEHVNQFRQSGLSEAAAQFHVGVNGGQESEAIARALFPKTASITFHGLGCHTENRTILELEQWLGRHSDWYVLYAHAKGATHEPGHALSTGWRRCMSKHAILNWRRCVLDLDAGYEAVGSHWLVPPLTPIGQYIFAGNFWWAKAAFLATIPSILGRERIKISGLDALESRYEAEVKIGNGPRRPIIRDYHPNCHPANGRC